MHGIHSWVNKNMRGRKGQRGFTLIELLVVVTILGILAGIVTLSLVGLTTHANVQACQAEYKTVQSALDAYLADQQAVNGTGTITAQTTPTNDMATNTAGVKLYNANPNGVTPNYTRNGTTQFWYEWDQFGRITNISSDATATHSVGDAVNGICSPK